MTTEDADRLGFETRAIHAGQDPDAATGAVVPPIHLATTYAQAEVGVTKGFEYSRSGNPTRAVLEATLANLESARFGFAFASGLAAEDAILRTLPVGAHSVVPHDAYGGTFRLMARVYGPSGAEFTPTDLSDIAAVEAAWRDDTAMVWIESPTNPSLGVVDIEKVAEIARRRGAVSVVDNTFATPYLQRPLEMGADIVVHSVTKYLGGHSDVVGGFVALDDAERAEQIRFFQNAAGAVPSPFDCYLVLRGLKTLAVRMDRHQENARAVVALLQAHPAVADVRYPGFGGMVSFTLHGGEAAALEVARRTRLFTLAESLGAVESLIEHPGRMTHASVAGSPLEVDAAMLRLSVGIETGADLVADLRQALDSL